MVNSIYRKEFEFDKLKTLISIFASLIVVVVGPFGYLYYLANCSYDN